MGCGDPTVQAGALASHRKFLYDRVKYRTCGKSATGNISRKCYSIGEITGEFYIHVHVHMYVGGFVLLIFVEQLLKDSIKFRSTKPRSVGLSLAHPIL